MPFLPATPTRPSPIRRSSRARRRVGMKSATSSAKVILRPLENRRLSACSQRDRPHYPSGDGRSYRAPRSKRSIFPSLLRSVLLPRIVAAPRTHHEFAESLGLGFDANGPVAADALWGRRLVSDRVLVSNVVGHAAADRVHFIQRAREKTDSSGALRNGFKRPPGTARFLLAQQADGVHRGAVLFLQTSNRFFQRLPAGVVFPIRHHEENFLLQLGMVLHVDRGGHDGVVKRGSTAGFDLLQRLAQLINVAGELLIEVVLVVKVDHKDLILRIAGPYQIQGSPVYLIALLAHRAGVVDHDAHRNRNILVPEGSNRLRLIILKDAEGALVQRRHQMVLVVHHRRVQHDFFDFLLEDKNSAIGRRLPLILRGLRRVGLRWARLRLCGLRLAGLSRIFLILLLRILGLWTWSRSLRRLLRFGSRCCRHNSLMPTSDGGEKKNYK